MISNPPATARIGALLGFAMLVLLGCATNPAVVDHAFSFDVRYDGQDAEVLDYRYGASNMPVRAPESAVREGKPVYQTNVNGPMLRGDSLYVKWRDKATGQIYEDTVDLRHRLPANITDQRIHFLIKGAQLYVYLISAKSRPPNMPVDGPRMYRDLENTLIYPDKPKP
ncbi:MAG TPA: hypothetical protein VEW70_16110 [Burkholderiales bacterium]|jgi:hypothetical protein|nr:hypothetical protein [Burkholderiales bacterium]